MRTYPRATYRVQLREEFDFDAAAAIVPYLEALGISHLYCSPYMRAAGHSPHGYDVVDPTLVSEELGGDAGLRRLDVALRTAQMGQLLDVVPNHMCIADRANAWWWDVLRFGRSSEYARFFDIDWDAPGLQGRVLLPVLGAPRAELLATGDLAVVRGTEGEFELRYADQAFPLAPGTAVAPGPVTLETLEAQHYLLEDSKSGADHLNYRRFFDVTSLAGLCVEIDAVFERVLARALDLVAEGTVDGLRVDHIDGLRDPAAFAVRLRSEATGSWLLAEKIMATGESLPKDWPIDGTTGYEFGALMASLMVDSRGHSEIIDCYRQFTGDTDSFETHSHRARRLVFEDLLTAELGRLSRAAERAGIADAATELVELVAGMPRYRTYPRADDRLSVDDEQAIGTAEQWARESGRCDQTRLDAVLAVLRGQGDSCPARRELRERFQQVAGAVMAKGVEDTAFYRFVPLVALNEVGSDPTRVAHVGEFHANCVETLADHPLTLLATTTHDTKRAEDARLRVGLLTEIPERWREALVRLDGIAARHRGAHPPSRRGEYLLFQSLVAAHPIDADRAWAYMLKASREAKDETSWIDPDQEYESGLESFVRGMVADPDADAEIRAVIASMTPEWQTLSLSQTLIKLTAPGIPDIYQGSELWDLRLVDPDNRAPVDFDARRRLLRDVTGHHRGDFMARLDEGAPKLRLIAAALAVRARHPDAFGSGSGYRLVTATGSRADHAICFSRTGPDGQPVTITIAFRLPLALRSGWGDAAVLIPEGSWRDVLTNRDLTGGTHALETLLRDAPIALLERA